MKTKLEKIIEEVDINAPEENYDLNYENPEQDYRENEVVFTEEPIDYMDETVEWEKTSDVTRTDFKSSHIDYVSYGKFKANVNVDAQNDVEILPTEYYATVGCIENGSLAIKFCESEEEASDLAISIAYSVNIANSTAWDEYFTDVEDVAVEVTERVSADTSDKNLGTMFENLNLMTFKQFLKEDKS